MVNAASVQNKINFGFIKTAKVIGDTYNWYRPAQAITPIGASSLLGTALAQFAQDPFFVFYKPADFPVAHRWYGTFSIQDTLQAFDYFVGHGGTFYNLDIERFVAVECIWCNRTVTVARPAENLILGTDPNYGGESVEFPEIILQGWPVSLRLLGSGMKMRGTDLNLPSDAPLGGYQMFIPPLAGAMLQYNDIVTDDLGRRYVISSLETSPLGWRVSMEMWPP